MRILHIHDKQPQDGGVAAHVRDISLALTRLGHHVDELRLVGAQQAAAKGDTAHRLPASYGVVQGMKLRGELRKVLEQAQPDIAHVHGCFTTLSPVLLAELRATVPVVGTLHDTRPFCYQMTRRFAPTGQTCERRCGAGCFASGCVPAQGVVDVARLARRLAMDGLTLRQWQRMSRVIAPSSYLRDLAVQHGIPAESVRVVPHGSAVPDLSHVREKASPPLIVYVGSLLDYKGPQVLVEALAQLRDLPWQAVLVGEGPLRPQLEQQIAQLGLQERITLPGHMADRAALDHLLARARVAVVPSIIAEAFSMAGLEALAAGTPVVSFGLGGVAEWLRDEENGLRAGMNTQGLARQLRRLLADETLAARLGQRGRRDVQARFTAGAAISALSDVYVELSLLNQQIKEGHLSERTQAPPQEPRI